MAICYRRCIIGFLDHSTNNIILDAVLTDTGRKFLARNDGSFSIVKFALSDDEVDYGIIKKFGRTVGKEKIEKNTAVFEALTGGNQSQKHTMMSVSNPHLIRLPTFELTGDGVTTDVVSMGRNKNTFRSLTMTQTIKNTDSIDVELRDQAFIVTVNSLFLQVRGQAPDDVDFNNMATYLLVRDDDTSAIGGSKISMTLEVKSLTDSHFTTYGVASNKNRIRTFAKVRGIQSGAVKEFEIQIDN